MPWAKTQLQREGSLWRASGRVEDKEVQGAKIQIPNRMSIDDRPAHANGQTLGDWETDTIVGKNGKGAIVTLVERKTTGPERKTDLSSQKTWLRKKYIKFALTYGIRR